MIEGHTDTEAQHPSRCPEETVATLSALDVAATDDARRVSARVNL